MAAGRPTKMIHNISMAALFAIVFGIPGVTGAEAPSDFYRDKVIRLVVGYAPGGGYDAFARLIAPPLEARTGATVVVENRPGAGGLVALNQVVAARPDGLSLMLVNGEGAALAQLLGEEGVRYDLRDVIWLGRVASEPRILMRGREAPFRSLGDAIGAPRAITWAAGGKTDSIADVVSFASFALGLDSRIIIGYGGSSEAALAVMRGEADAIVVSESSARKHADGGELIPVVVLGRERSRLLPDLPTVFDAVSLEGEKAWWIDYRSQLTEIGRALITTPAVPEDRARFLRESVESVLLDPSVQREGLATGRPLSFAPASRLRDLVVSTLSSLDPARIEEIRQVVLERYY